MATQTNELRDAALEYARRHWRVFPCWWIQDGRCACPQGASCTGPGKHPLTPHGLKDATDDAEAIRLWWAKWPLAHVAIATGAASGLVVIDLDRKRGKDGVASLKAALGQVPVTLTVHTGSGGLHLYFKHPGGWVPNSAGELGPGIDIRGDRGYVIAPPSGHVSGGRYEW